MRGGAMPNPFGSCSSCVWHSVEPSIDTESDVWKHWKCWRLSGAPETRMTTASDKEPPACECYLKEE